MPCWGLNCAPIKIWTSECNIRKRVFVEVTILRWGHSGLGQVLNQKISAENQRRTSKGGEGSEEEEDGYRNAERWGPCGDGRRRPELCSPKPRNTGAPTARRRQEEGRRGLLRQSLERDPALRRPREGPSPPSPWFWTLDLQSFENCCFKLLSLWFLVMVAPGLQSMPRPLLPDLRVLPASSFPLRSLPAMPCTSVPFPPASACWGPPCFQGQFIMASTARFSASSLNAHSHHVYIQHSAAHARLVLCCTYMLPPLMFGNMPCSALNLLECLAQTFIYSRASKYVESSCMASFAMRQILFLFHNLGMKLCMQKKLKPWEK